MKSTLIILTFNEIQGVKTLFSRIPFGSFDESIVIDYKSTDGTVEYFKERNIKVIPQEKRGRGEAFRMAQELSTGDLLVFFSPDGNEVPEDAIKLKNLIEQENDMAIASRFAVESRSDDSSSKFPYRSWGNKFFTLIVNLFFGGRLTDSINGFRAVRKDKLKELKINAEGFAIEYQMSIRALKLGQKIKEIPTVEGERIGGKSTAKTFPTGWKLLKIFFREVLIGKKF
jgi:glycosyltransferase involved in cell wall biosynthesis